MSRKEVKIEFNNHGDRDVGLKGFGAIIDLYTYDMSDEETKALTKAIALTLKEFNKDFDGLCSVDTTVFNGLEIEHEETL